MTSIELCRTAGLTERELRNWLDYGLLDVDVVGRDGGPSPLCGFKTA
jgi:hypothetical protein